MLSSFMPHLILKLVFAVFLALPMVSQASELRLLIDMLHENGMVSEEQYGRLLAELEQNQQKSAKEKQEIVEKLELATQPPEVEVTTKGGLRVRTTDGEFETRLRGRLMIDAADYKGDPEMGDGTNIRRARLAWTGRMYRDWGFQLDYDFADGGKMRDSFISYLGFEDTRLRVGLMEIPFQLQYRSSSSNSQLIERSLLGAFGGDRYIGVMADTKKQHWTAAAGLFGETATRQNPIVDEGWGVGARFTVAPINNEKDKLLHFGIASMYRNVEDVGVIEFSDEPEARVAGNNIVDTGEIFNTDSFTRYGAEWAMINGRLSAQSEYVLTTVERSSADDLKFSGWHFQTGFFLTDDSLNYQRGDFGSPSPNKRLGDGGIGAWELTLRYSSLDLNDKLIDGGEIQNITYGVNWYPVPMLRFSANYIDVLNVSGGPNDGQEQRIFLVRSQWAF
ncbi:MAG: porin [Methylophaga sp.]|jgi:phosphate-selective porin OprO/OprP|nr:porin [Methylophaga sp.]MAY16823.1 porin [Methylophaga sp.]HAO26262.1 porin [Methylophaga sp.]HCD04547.1 porin [Methylophaga sp.]|tara:strand:+ start:8022 stop:9365 length:1344 start_codon:yes stop_codon:yes gene_type:complete